ncbi:MAG: allantoinase PuuE [Bosea sp. (in: a-proteobacteria)]|uniref:allantoinase PuuE n=1 Tax=Bosea sp. (in: a-proteobacteria) TaxID=1871050 RepID=UPI002732A58A|nr:allantoinase PuuE [Bosea sp. (in: a-proteobacteria)]MDP3599951.1 allantoinase PuuE [Bosea sp. (in: a-proteobacteria)]
MTDTAYPRDLEGYGRTPPHPRWPGKARIAVQFVINYEEGGENNILHGDAASEAFLSEIVGAAPWPGQRHMNMESIYEYGSRAGYWRLWRMFTERNMPVTVFAIASALKRYPEIAASMQEAGWEIATHGLKWIDYRDVPAEKERADILEAIAIQREITGERPLGFYQGRSSERTTPLMMDEGGFLYTADSYADELPYWLSGPKGPQLAVPYTLDANDMRFATPQGFNSGDQFFAYLRDSFDLLYAEGATAPKMMSIGLHCRLVGRPGRAAALARFLDHVQGHDDVWVATRLDIARHWVRHHPPAGGYRPSAVPKALFVEVFGRIWENAPWIAEATFDAGITAAHDDAATLHAAMATVMRAAPREKLKELLLGHPDLAGKLAAAGEMTEESIGEQASAGLDRLAPSERARFTQLNDAYKARFGIPFIMAVAGASKDAILQAFETRLQSTPEVEFETALGQVERISLLRLKEIMR